MAIIVFRELVLCNYMEVTEKSFQRLCSLNLDAYLDRSQRYILKCFLKLRSTVCC